ncbi:carbon-nitrogen hydrolase family protein [Haliangium sp.]|uniref:carbon-nitrogen hydrolase family protein n=1 Tax=Haliangium sp. TaxID=2663208 RepID=UPI003D1477EF
MSGRRFHCAAVQMCAGDDLQANLATCRRLTAEAASRGAELVILPENFAFLGRTDTAKLAVAEEVEPAAEPGPIVATLIDLATHHRLWMVGGGMPERIPAGAPASPAGAPASPAGAPASPEEPSRTYNTCVVVSPDGAIAARYRKLHLFDLDIPGQVSLCESRATARGDEPVVCDTALARLGLSICYDLRFPELYRELVVARGAQVVLVPSAFTAHTGAAHWHTLLRARAIENQCYVVAPAQAGQHNDKRNSYGHSLIVDPWGTVLDEVPDSVLEGVAVAEVDLDAMDEVRRRMPCLEHPVLLP